MAAIVNKPPPRALQIRSAAVHPLVLLHVVDHFNRATINKRICGVLLGSIQKDGTAEVTNAFAIPFDEDKKTGVFYVDHLYCEEMAGMFKRVTAHEVILGWYHSEGELCGNDILIHQTFRAYTDNPLLLVVNVKEMTEELPCKAYLSRKTVAIHSIEEVDTFYNLDVTLVASVPEEVGVEHVLRDVQDQEHVPTLGAEVNQKRIGLNVLKKRMNVIKDYLQSVQEGNMPLNQDILYLLQEIFNMMPDINTPVLRNSITKVMNDQSLSIYVASIVRSILALDGLIINREKFDTEGKPKEKKEEKKEETSENKEEVKEKKKGEN